VLRVLLVDNDETEAARSSAGLMARLADRVATVHVASLAAAIRALMETPSTRSSWSWGSATQKGVATLAGVRGAAPAVPVVVYTRELDDGLMLRALRAGAQECLSKRDTPPEGLARALSFAIERQRRLATLEAARSEAAHRATHDPLTGLANVSCSSTSWSARWRSVPGTAGRPVSCSSTWTASRAINDTMGHATGDQLLKAVATRLLESVRRSDAVARLGGDEFVVLLPDVTSRRDVAHVRETILLFLQEPIDVGGGQSLVCEASIGSAMSPLDGANAQELLDAADAEMYRDKNARRRGRAATPVGGIPASPAPAPGGATPLSGRLGASPAGVRAASTEARLREAMRRDEFEVHYQPILDVVADRVVAAEALLRWRDPDRGLVMPSTFLPLAEDTGLIVPIGEQVLRTACEAIVRWRQTGRAQLTCECA
jgi:diguanylate cyclase (GGDEF)-like protein